MTTVAIFLPSMSGTIGNTLWLYKSSDYSLVNAGGDALTEIGTSGWFTATVEEAWTETLAATVLDTNSLASGYGWLAVGATQISDGTAGLDSATQAIINALLPLSGPYTRTITVTDSDSSDPIEAALVRLYRTGETETKPTDDAGVATFLTQAATWSYSITANGYGGASGTIVISADGETDVELTLNAITPPTNPDLSALTVLCLDEKYAPESGVAIYLRIVSHPDESVNLATKGTKQTATSGVDGVARLEAMKGSTSEWKRGTADEWHRVTIGRGDATNVTSIVGSP